MQDVRVLSCFVQTLEQSIPGFVKSALRRRILPSSCCLCGFSQT